jgi:rare lipoprotein A
MTVWVRAAALCLGLLVVAGCAPQLRDSPTGPSADRERDRAPTYVPADIALLPDPQPRREPLSRYGNHSPYVVWGQSYEVMESADGYRSEGLASWYGAKFHGRPTSSGEPYDMYQLTAAHRSLPLPSYVRVTNLDNGRSVVVRVNDRGPFHDQRIIDLSFAAAVRLDFVDRGTAPVRVEMLAPPAEPGSTRTPIPAPPPVRPEDPISADTTRPVPAMYLQAGAFSERTSADRLKQSLLGLINSDSSQVEVRAGGDDGLFRVWIGPIWHMAEVSRIQDLLVAENHARPHLIRVP